MLFPEHITEIKKQLISYNVLPLLKLLLWLLPADSLKSTLSSIHPENTFVRKSSVILLVMLIFLFSTSWTLCSALLGTSVLALLVLCSLPELPFLLPSVYSDPCLSSSPHPPSTQSMRPSLFILLSFRWRPFFCNKGARIYIGRRELGVVKFTPHL